MTRLLSYLLFSGLTVGAGLVVIDSASFVVAQANEATVKRCNNMNSILPGSCQMP
jgi:hypothetical protein